MRRATLSEAMAPASESESDASDEDQIEEEEILDEVEMDEEEEDGDEDDEYLFSQSPKKRKMEDQGVKSGSGIIVETAFDAYFTHAASRAQTSTNVFSSLVPPLTAEEYSEAISSMLKMQQSVQIQSSLLSSSSSLDQLFARFLWELHDGFNVLAYGYGSKRKILNQFAVERCSKRGFVVIVNAFQPSFTLRQLLSSIENVPGILASETRSGSGDGQVRRIYDFFARHEKHLYLIIHNIDAVPLRSAKAKSTLGMLALNPRIHIVASIDHINAPLLWSASETSARSRSAPDEVKDGDKDNHESEGGQDLSALPPPRGFAWLWHDLTTLAPYDFELSHADRSSISGAHAGTTLRKKADATSAQSGAGMTETAALHILASVTQKAQKLFVMMGAKQLESIEEAGETAANDLQQHGIGYDMLFNLARDDFIATNDTALRSLLAEFRDHGLVLATQGGSGGEVLWIPLRQERLNSVLKSDLLQ